MAKDMTSAIVAIVGSVIAFGLANDMDASTATVVAAMIALVATIAAAIINAIVNMRSAKAAAKSAEAAMISALKKGETPPAAPPVEDLTAKSIKRHVTVISFWWGVALAIVGASGFEGMIESLTQHDFNQARAGFLVSLFCLTGAYVAYRVFKFTQS